MNAAQEAQNDAKRLAVLKCVAEGLSAPQFIADELGMSRQWCRYHLIELERQGRVIHTKYSEYMLDVPPFLRRDPLPTGGILR